MKKRLLIVLTTGFGLLFLNSTTMAGYLDSGWENISQYDSTQNDGYGNTNRPNSWKYKYKEDNEVEPGAATGQKWDIEGFFFSDGTDGSVPDNDLALVGGFDFKDGQGGIPSGDIFIDTDLGNGYYEYVMDLDFGTGKYDVIQSTAKDGEITYTKAKDSGFSGPTATGNTAWKYYSGGTTIGSGLAFQYLQYNSNSGVGGGLKGANGDQSHNIVQVNLGFLGGNTSFTVLNTMGCANDVVVGWGETPNAAVPEPATIFLLGSGLLGLFGYRKKFRKSKS